MSAITPEIDDYFRDFCNLMEQAAKGLSEEDYIELQRRIKREL